PEKDTCGRVECHAAQTPGPPTHGLPLGWSFLYHPGLADPPPPWMSASPFLVVSALVLVLVNAFFVAAEFAMVRVRPTRVSALAQEGGWRAQVLARTQKHLDTFLSATQLGITLSSLGLGWLGEPAFAELLGGAFAALGITSPVVIRNTSVAVAFALITFLHIVIGELAPKSYAIR